MPTREFRVTATFEETIEVDQDSDWQVCENHKAPEGETLEQMDARWDAIASCDACREKAWDEAYGEAYDRFSRADDLEVEEV